MHAIRTKPRRKKLGERAVAVGYWGLWQRQHYRSARFVGWFSSPGKLAQAMGALVAELERQPISEHKREFEIVWSRTVADVFLRKLDQLGDPQG